MCRFTCIFGLFLHNNTDRLWAHVIYTCDEQGSFTSAWVFLNIPLSVHFCVVHGVLGNFPRFLFGFPFSCAESVTGVFSGLNLGPPEGSRSRFGQQTGCERFHDGGGDQPVSHTRQHHNTLVARSSLLRTDRRRVSGTHTSHTLLIADESTPLT